MTKRVLVLYRDAKRVPPYRDALLVADLEPDVIVAGSPFTLKKHDGLLLIGGQDVNPKLYGEAQGHETDTPDPELDAAEMSAIDQALDLDLPILAICRGMQLLNVHHGGSLIQHLDPPERHRRRDEDRSLPVHSVSIESGSLLGDITGTDAWQVNSRHHQAVNRIGANLRISARHPDDSVVEAIERTDRSFVLGIQWHPEDQILRYPAQLELFHRFARAMTAR